MGPPDLHTASSTFDTNANTNTNTNTRAPGSTLTTAQHRHRSSGRAQYPPTYAHPDLPPSLPWTSPHYLPALTVIDRPLASPSLHPPSQAVAPSIASAVINVSISRPYRGSLSASRRGCFPSSRLRFHFDLVRCVSEMRECAEGTLDAIVIAVARPRLRSYRDGRPCLRSYRNGRAPMPSYGDGDRAGRTGWSMTLCEGGLIRVTIKKQARGEEQRNILVHGHDCWETGDGRLAAGGWVLATGSWIASERQSSHHERTLTRVHERAAYAGSRPRSGPGGFRSRRRTRAALWTRIVVQNRINTLQDPSHNWPR
ncbi:hypothetical protein DENSPDRAFT_227233 [Dentipellis sp. KUC8613]|nr:hypothetical protein DENSPDRAFT_227233 [Dentipellis sp. KUC8613]